MSTLAEWIAQIEGYNTPGTIANRNNNPGALRYAPNQIGQENTVNGKFATFASPQEGWLALENYIQNNSDKTLRSFVYQYAPPNENDTAGYLNYLSGKLGVTADVTLDSILYGNRNNVGDVSSFDSLGSDLLDYAQTTNGMIVLGGLLVIGLLAIGDV